MERIDRYLLREIALPFAVSVMLVVTSVFLLQARRLATAALGFGLDLGDAAIIFVSALPPFLIMAVPIAYLLSVLVGLGRLAGDLELIAMRAAGASAFRIARIPLLLGAIVALATIPIAVIGEPYGFRVLHARLIEVGMRNLTGAIRPGVFNEDFRGSAVYARSRDEAGKLEDVLFYDERDAEHTLLITARAGTFSSTKDRGISFELEGGEMHLGKTSTASRYERVRFERASLGLDAQRELSRRTSFVPILGRMTNEEMQEQLDTLTSQDDLLKHRIQSAYWRRFAIPSMALVLGAVGAAIAMTGRARSRARSSLLGLGSIVFYYVLTRIASFLVVQGSVSAFAGAWLPNAFLLGVALVAIARAGGAKR